MKISRGGVGVTFGKEGGEWLGAIINSELNEKFSKVQEMGTSGSYSDAFFDLI